MENSAHPSRSPSRTSSAFSTPEALPSIDLTIWRNAGLETAAACGMTRDARLGRRHDKLSRTNEADFDARFAPRDTADVILPTT